MCTPEPSRRRVCVASIAAALAVALCAVPAAAEAATAAVDGTGKLTYTAVAGETNHLTVAPGGSGYTVTDTGATITAGTGCIGSGGMVTCSGVLSLNVLAGDSDDIVDTSAAPITTTVDGAAGADEISTGTAADTINAGGDFDTVDGGLGSDILTGGPGSDVVSYASHSASEPVSIDLDGTQDDGCSSCGENDRIGADFESLLGGAGADTLVGNGVPNYLSGGFGSDTITGGGGSDYIAYFDRSDPITLDFATGNFGNTAIGEHDTITDTIVNGIGGTGSDRFVGNAAANVLWGGWSGFGGEHPDGDDTMRGGGGADMFVGDAGNDTVEYSDRAAGTSLSLTLDGTANDGAPGENDNLTTSIENVTGGAGGDTITGDLGPNKLDGGPGMDLLEGGPGDDTLTARDGAVDQLVCGGGTDGGTADDSDTIATDCEAVALPPPPSDPPATDPPATDPPAGDPPTDPAQRTEPPRNSQPPRIPSQTASVTRNGVALVKLVCPADSGGCSGTVALELIEAAPAPGRGKIAVSARRRRVSIGRSRFKAKAGKTTTVRVRLSKRGRQRILRGRKKTRRVRLSTTTRTADGKVEVTSRTISVRAERRQPRRPGRKNR
jgi:Ca2+-binding RTX toxin-like protein